jgi:zeaxanthin glucosyltransferase
MSKVLCITSGLTGILNSSFELVSRLQSAGHNCVIGTPLDVKDKVEINGFNYFQFDAVNFEPAPNIPKYRGVLKKVKRLTYKFINNKKRTKEAIENLGMDSFLEKIKDIKPDLVLIDIELHEHLMTLITAKYNVVLLSQWFSTWNRKGLPPILQDTIPGIGFRGSKLGMTLSWLKIDLQRWWIFTKKKLISGFTDRRSILQLYGKQVGFPKKYIPDNYWPGPFSYDILPVISMTSEALDFPHDVRPNLTYVGPMVFEERKDVNNDSGSEINLIIEKAKAENKKLIYCSVSTFKKGDIGFLKKVVKALESKSEWILIISLGGLIDSNEFVSLPENVFAFNKVNQLQVLKNADLSINHGGIHTINECVHYKVPMLVYSGKKSDQNGCAARIHYHGIGIMADKDLDSISDVQSNVEEILTDKNIIMNKYSLFEEKNKESELLKIINSEFG